MYLSENQTENVYSTVWYDANKRSSNDPNPMLIIVLNTKTFPVNNATRS